MRHPFGISLRKAYQEDYGKFGVLSLSRNPFKWHLQLDSGSSDFTKFVQSLTRSDGHVTVWACTIGAMKRVSDLHWMLLKDFQNRMNYLVSLNTSIGSGMCGERVC